MDADALQQNWELNGGQLENDFFSSACKIQKHTGSLGYVKFKKKRWLAGLCMNTAQVLNHEDLFLTATVKCFVCEQMKIKSSCCC